MGSNFPQWANPSFYNFLGENKTKMKKSKPNCFSLDWDPARNRDLWWRFVSRGKTNQLHLALVGTLILDPNKFHLVEAEKRLN